MKDNFKLLAIFTVICFFSINTTTESIDNSEKTVIPQSTIASDTKTLDDIALKYGADKSSAWHGYTKEYARNFDKLRDKKIVFLEIGTCRGCSAKMWEEYFTHSETQLITVDIDPSAGKFVENLAKTSFFTIDQSNPNDLLELGQLGGEFDIIIDDGSHVSQDQILSFKLLFPHIKNGGVYVIEDLLFSYHPEHTSYEKYKKINNPKACENSTILFLGALIDDINYAGAITGCAHIGKTNLKTQWEKLKLNLAEIDKKLTYFQRYIDRIEFAGSICFIYKK